MAREEIKDLKQAARKEITDLKLALLKLSPATKDPSKAPLRHDEPKDPPSNQTMTEDQMEIDDATQDPEWFEPIYEVPTTCNKDSKEPSDAALLHAAIAVSTIHQSRQQCYGR